MKRGTNRMPEKEGGELRGKGTIVLVIRGAKAVRGGHSGPGKGKEKGKRPPIFRNRGKKPWKGEGKERRKINKIFAPR